RRVEAQLAAEPDVGRDGGVDQLVEGVVAEGVEHLPHLFGARADVAGDEGNALEELCMVHGSMLPLELTRGARGIYPPPRPSATPVGGRRPFLDSPRGRGLFCPIRQQSGGSPAFVPEEDPWPTSRRT